MNIVSTATAAATIVQKSIIDNNPPQGIVKYIFNPYLCSLKQICEFLQKSPLGTAHPCSENGRRTLLVWTGENIDSYDISMMDPKIFLSNARLSDLAELITNHIDRFHPLVSFKDFSVQLLKPGEIFDLPIHEEIMVFAVTDKKDGHYFDLSIYFGGNRHCLTYNIRNVEGLQHSGDVGSLLHYVKGFDSFSDGKAMIFTVTGFRKRKLRYFENQLPCVIFVDHEKKTNFVVPCPLDSATIGEASMSGLVVAYKYRDSLRCSVLSAPMTISDVDTGEMNQQIQDKVDLAFQQSQVLLAQVGNQPVNSQFTAHQSTSSADITSLTFEVNADHLADDTPEYVLDFVHLIQDGITSHLKMDQSIIFGLRFSTYPSEDLPTVLPHVFGEVTGVSACALGCLPTRDFHIEKLLSHLPVIVEVDDISWQDSIVPSCQYSGNCIMIIKPGSAIQNEYSKHSRNETQFKKNLEGIMNGICVNATCMAGPNSIVVVNLGSEMFWYRGVRYDGLMDVVPAYCSDVTDMFSQSSIVKWLSSKPHFPWPNILQRDVQQLVPWVF